MPASHESAVPVAGQGSAHDEMMDRLKQRLGRIREVVPPSTPVVYIDYPVHENVGDLLIHAGADAFLEDSRYKVLARYSIEDLAGASRTPSLRPSIRDVDALVARGATIILHGGGNVGDIWPRHQQFRELIIQRFANSRIVIFPQSVHFNDAQARARSAAVMRAHPNLHIFVRDEESLEFAAKDCARPAEVMPDTAHQLWRRPMFDRAARSAGRGTLVQRRRDRETRGEGAASAATFDWIDLRPRGEATARKALVRWYRTGHPLRGVVPNWWSWYLLRDRLIRRAVEHFARFEAVETDRLHGVILAALLGRRAVFSDNYYGKIARYHRRWMSQSDRIAPIAAAGPEH